MRRECCRRRQALLSNVKDGYEFALKCIEDSPQRGIVEAITLKQRVHLYAFETVLAQAVDVLLGRTTWMDTSKADEAARI